MRKLTLWITVAYLIVWCVDVMAGYQNKLPRFIVNNSVDIAEYSGVRDANGNADDLLSGGLNADGLQLETPPDFADPLNPNAAELRRRAIYTNYRAITDMSTGGGYGLFWGPALAPTFDGDVEQGLIPGVEYKALMKKPSYNVNNVPVTVQIPNNFDPEDPCVFLASPSGSRGYYGGIAIAEWGLFTGCAVVLPGKATGTGYHLLGTDEVYDRNGVLKLADHIGRKAQFAVEKNRKLKEFIAEHPFRVATKHAHSQINPERLWGDLALKGIEFAFWVLNDRFDSRKLDMNSEDYGIDDEYDYHDEDDYDASHRRAFRPENTLVIASGTSNGAGTSLRALENDRFRLIDGLVVIEPSINPDSAGKFIIDFGGDIFVGHGTSLYDNMTLMSIYAPCAALSRSLVGTPLNSDPIGAPGGARANRCKSLKDAGLLLADTQQEQATESLSILRVNGYYKAQDVLLASHEWLNLWRSLNPTYASAHGRFAVWNNLCGISFAATDDNNEPVAVPPKTAVMLFATSSGIPASSGINLVNDAAVNGPILENRSISPTSGREDLNLDGARCFRYLATGDSSLLDGEPGWKDRIRFKRVQRGIQETRTHGDLHGIPSIILAGRSDALVFPNYHSRPYYGLNQIVEGEDSRLSYIEVVNAQHFEALISTLWLDPATGGVQFVPLHYYLFQALDWMYDYLKGERDSLPSSQVIRPMPRGLKAYEVSDTGSGLLPNIQIVPAVDNRITFSDGVLTIPK